MKTKKETLQFSIVQNLSSEDSSSSMDINNSVSSSNAQQQSEQQIGGTLFGGVGGGFGNTQVNIPQTVHALYSFGWENDVLMSATVCKVLDNNKKQSHCEIADWIVK